MLSSSALGDFSASDGPDYAQPHVARAGFTVARERRLRGQASQESLRQEALERRKQAMDAVQPPAEVGGVRVAGSVVDPRQGGPRPAGPAQGVESGGDLSLHATSMPLLPREADRGAVREGAGEEDPNEVGAA